MSGAISGLGVGLVAVGGLVTYAGFLGVSPVVALADIASGHPTGLAHQYTGAETAAAQVAQAAGIAAANVSGNGLRSAVVANASKYMGDKYSQLRRSQPGWSDCSSFVDKCLRDAGISPPGSPWANTLNYLNSSQWPTITQAEALPGDVAVATGHMVLITAAGGSAAVGQENSRINVRTGSVAGLFSSSQHYVYKTWTGYAQAAKTVPGPKTGAGL